ncbi:MAG: HDOD domain-containing protein [Lachnospiraceae bacterium]|nr:HDOD domain-containing protein [Lachnospiraceae bacterium]
MLATLIPLFNENMEVKAYSLFSQKKNYLLNPSYLGTGINDGAGVITGLDVVNSVGIDSLATNSDIFVSLTPISLFADIEDQCFAPPHRIVLLIDNSVKPQPLNIERIKALKDTGYQFAMRKLDVPDFEVYKEILSLMDYLILDHKKIVISKAKIFFSKLYPNIKLVAGNIANQEIFESLKREGGYSLYEGEFYRTPITRGSEATIAPVKINYIELLNVINDPDFELTKAADVISRDAALTISLLEMVNKITVNSKISNIRQATALLGQRELKKWISTAVTKQLCEDRPSEVARLSMLRAKFAEQLAPVFNMAMKDQELFMLGLFSCLDIILEKPMEEALKILNVSKEISDALINNSGELASIYEFILLYEHADWFEIDRIVVLNNLDYDKVYDAYVTSLKWYRDLFF